MVRFRPPDRPAAPGPFSHREIWRLSVLVLGAAVVGLVIRELSRPRAAAVVDQVMAVTAEPASAVSGPPPAVKPADPAQFRHLLKLGGWDEPRFASLAEGPLTDAKRNELVELLWRLTTFDAPQLAAWARDWRSGPRRRARGTGG